MTQAFTPVLGLWLMSSGQGRPDVPVNESLRLIEAAVRGVDSRALSAPSGPSVGEQFIVKATGTGDWADHDDEVACYVATDEWRFIVPVDDLMLWCRAERSWVRWNGTAWCNVGGVFAASASAATGLTGSFSNLSWTTHNRDLTGSEVFTHDTSTNSEQITLVEAGDYEVKVSVTFEATATASYNQCDVKLTLGGSDVTDAKAFGVVRTTDIPKVTVTLTRVITATAGQVLRVAVARSSGTSTVNTRVETNIVITKLA